MTEAEIRARLAAIAEYASPCTNTQCVRWDCAARSLLVALDEARAERDLEAARNLALHNRAKLAQDAVRLLGIATGTFAPANRDRAERRVAEVLGVKGQRWSVAERRWVADVVEEVSRG